MMEERAYETLARVLGMEPDAALRLIEETWTTGSERDDLALLFRDFANDDDRLAAADRIVDRIGPLRIGKRRWELIRAQLGTNATTKMRRRLRQRLFEAVRTAAGLMTFDEYFQPGPDELTQGQDAIRKELRNVLSEDILGPQWRDRWRETPLDKTATHDLDSQAPRGDRKASALLDRLASKASRREKELLKLLAGGLSAPKAAEAMKISPATVRKMRQRLRAKLGRP